MQIMEDAMSSRRPRLKLVPMYLEPDLYRRLDEAARENDRELTQQARHIIRVAIADGPNTNDRQPVEAAS
jgi:hypothetical protein